MKAIDPYRSLRRWAVAATLFLGIIVFVQEGWSQHRQGSMVGRQAPHFEIQGVYGETYSLETFKGHILVMQFGTSW